jgi:hypothetical protein
MKKHLRKLTNVLEEREKAAAAAAEAEKKAGKTPKSATDAGHEE